MKIANKVVMTLAGLLLIAASGLKIAEMLNLCIPGWREKGIWESYEFFLVQIPLELSLGIWLVSGLFRKAAWLAGTAAFFGFIFVTLYKGVTGAESCGCFGQVHVNPWITLSLIDVPMFLLMALNRPGKECKLLPPPWPNTFYALVIAAPIFASLILISPALAAFKPKCVKTDEMESKTKTIIIYKDRPCARLHADELKDPNKAIEIIPNNARQNKEPNSIIHIPPTDTTQKPVESNNRQQQNPPTNPEATQVELSKWLEYIDIADQLKQGFVVVLMYHHDCPTCATVVPEYDKFYRQMQQQNDDSMKFAFIAIPPYNEKGPVPADTPCLRGKLKEKKGEVWAITSPYVMALIDGQKVKDWKEGTAPKADKIWDEVFGDAPAVQ